MRNIINTYRMLMALFSKLQVPKDLTQCPARGPEHGLWNAFLQTISPKIIFHLLILPSSDNFVVPLTVVFDSY